MRYFEFLIFYFTFSMLISILINIKLRKKLSAYRIKIRPKISLLISTFLGIGLFSLCIIYRPFMPPDIFDKEMQSRSEWLRNMPLLFAKEDCLSAKELSAEVKESVAKVLAVHPNSVSLGRTTYIEKCIATLYVPTGIYVCNYKTSVRDKIIHECISD